MDHHEARRRFASGRVARLATVDPDGQPHVVPVVFAADGERIYSIVDSKPKLSLRLKRLANIEGNSRVSLIVDNYDEDWTTLWWVRADGVAWIIDDGSLIDHAVVLLGKKYPQYGAGTEPVGPAIVVDVERWSGWSA